MYSSDVAKRFAGKILQLCRSKCQGHLLANSYELPVRLNFIDNDTITR